MSYAAEAIVSAAPPPSKPAAPKSATQPHDASAPSFNDHLAADTKAALTQAAPPVRDSNAHEKAGPVEASTSDEPAETEATTEASPQPAPQAPAPVAAPVLVQLIAQTNIAPTPAHAKSDNAKADAAPAEKSSDINLPAPRAAESAQPAPPPQSAPPAPDAALAPMAKPMQNVQAAPPPPIAAQAAQAAAQAARAVTTDAEPDAENSERSDDASAPTATPANAPSGVRVAPELPTLAASPARPSDAPAEPAEKIIAKNDDASTQEKFEIVLEKSAARGDAKPDAARAPNTPILIADASGAATAGANADTSAPIAPAVSALSAATTHAAAQTQALSAEHLARSAPPSAQVAREIVRQFDGESTRFELRLDPPELGRVEVKLEITRDHKVTAVIAADSPQALTELARHARELEQNLQSAGLELSDNGLSFDLRQSREDGQDANGDGERGSRGGGEDETLDQTAPLARPIGLERWRGARVDVMA